MGMYTEIFVNVKLHESTPDSVIQDLRALFDEDYWQEKFNDSFFEQDRMSCIGQMSSYYFQPKATSSIWFDRIANQWFILSRSDLKNYSGEIERFFDYLKEYVDEPEGQFIGYHRYEEDPAPVLVFAGERQ